jgi:hypothetical protein
MQQASPRIRARSQIQAHRTVSHHLQPRLSLQRFNKHPIRPLAGLNSNGEDTAHHAITAPVAAAANVGLLSTMGVGGALNLGCVRPMPPVQSASVPLALSPQTRRRPGDRMSPHGARYSLSSYRLKWASCLPAWFLERWPSKWHWGVNAGAGRE